MTAISVYGEKIAAEGRDDIRLLKLWSRWKGEIIQCTLEIHSLQRLPRYEALSYTWDHSGSKKVIKVHDTTFAVSRNLFSALKRLRYKTQSRMLWVDAICINQNDLDERSHQVERMR